MYPFNFPFAKFFASLGVRLSIMIVAIKDEEAGVYYAYSPNIKGLHVEGDTLDEVLQNVKDVLPYLLKINEGGTVEALTNNAPRLNLCTPLHA